MKLTMDKAGRLVVPKPLRDALGLSEGGVVDVSIYGSGLQLVPGGRTAQLLETTSGLVGHSETKVSDEDVFGLINAFRR